MSLFQGSMLHLKCRPVHMHPGAVVVAEPLQILLCVRSQDRTLQFSVYCGIAEERNMEQTVTVKVPEGTWGQGGRGGAVVVANLATEPTA